MIILEKGLKLNRKELADFFEISPKRFSNTRQKYLNDLSEYADYDLVLTDGGNLKYVIIKTVYCPRYYKTYKKEFLHWLENNDVFALTGEDGYSNAAIITNRYCKDHGIPYVGPHMIKQEFEGKTADGKRTVHETQTISNPDFAEWHYLHNICRRYLQEAGTSRIKEDSKTMYSGEYRPTYVHIPTEQEKEMREKIAYEIFGNQTLNAIELTHDIQDMDVRDMSAEELRTEIMSLRSMRDLSDDEKRNLYYSRCQEAGVLTSNCWRTVK